MNKLLALALMICTANSLLTAQESNALLFGTIKNSQMETVTLTNHYGQILTKTNQNGDYRFELNIESQDFFTFQIGSEHFTMIVLPGDTLEMNFDPANIKKTIAFQGQKAEVNQSLVSLSNGALAPDFTFTDPSGKEVSLSDYKGKYVYIDVWNSACGPCFKEFPAMEELVEKYAERNIVFLGVSFDSKDSKWRKTMEKKELKGIQLFANGWNSEFVKQYHIWFNPRFILVDKDQHIVYLSALRPTSDIESIFSELPGL